MELITKKGTKEKILECNICLKEFNRVGNLNVHKRTHNGERPFKCHLCEQEQKVLQTSAKRENYSSISK